MSETIIAFAGRVAEISGLCFETSHAGKNDASGEPVRRFGRWGGS